MKFDKDGNVIEDDNQAEGAEGADGDSGVSDETERALAGKIEGETPDVEERDASADELGDDPAKLKRAVEGLMKRMKKITAQRNSARDEAKVAKDLRETVKRLEQAERGRAVPDKEPEATPTDLKEEQRIAGIRAALEAAGLPVDRVNQMLERLDEQEAQQAASVTEQARGFLKSELEDYKVKVTPKILKRWEFATSSEIAEDPKLLEAYRNPATRQAAISVAFERAREIGDSVLDSLGVDKRLERVSKNREKVLGSTGDGAVAQIPEAGELTPPKDCKGDALDDWWKAQARKYAASLSYDDANA